MLKSDETQDQKNDKKRDDNRCTNVHTTGDNNFTFIIINLRYILFVKNIDTWGRFTQAASKGVALFS